MLRRSRRISGVCWKPTQRAREYLALGPPAVPFPRSGASHCSNRPHRSESVPRSVPQFRASMTVEVVAPPAERLSSRQVVAGILLGM